MQSESASIYWYANSNDRECTSRMELSPETISIDELGKYGVHLENNIFR